MITWHTARERLAADPKRWAEIARATGLPRMTVARIGSGKTPSPRIDTVEKITAFYERESSAPAQQ
jgi:hypothetical protein